MSIVLPTNSLSVNVYENGFDYIRLMWLWKAVLNNDKSIYVIGKWKENGFGGKCMWRQCMLNLKSVWLLENVCVIVVGKYEKCLSVNDLEVSQHSRTQNTVGHLTTN